MLYFSPLHYVFCSLNLLLSYISSAHSFAQLHFTVTVHDGIERRLHLGMSALGTLHGDGDQIRRPAPPHMWHCYQKKYTFFFNSNRWRITNITLTSLLLP
mmetsp:Transcript_1125/g.2504  ORF Transcript_1125/g.2504 Transcript_1125/m.2504 type:complete len:100 (+) Transcript_1125:240-539(+)